MKQRVLLKDIAYRKIKEKIMRGDFLDSNSTSENQLVEELQMSRTPIREALQRLQHEGLIKIISNQGIVIQELSIKETNDLFDMRIAIETYSLKKNVGFISQHDFKQLDDIIARQKQACAERDVFSFIQLDGEFHQYLLELGGNSLFIQMMSNIRDRLYFDANRLHKRYPDSIARLIEEHVKITEALKKGDYELAVQELEQHLQNGKITYIS
ncbi:GntR family transcriptional regulator [Brevibacillus marinus]|uniref:GntR family transcriptional regulator n=1 Tax=Brevibacillus marinus TaxID=2496837 RepID=UPI000F83FAD9|nr:GntR family transcriptional regulator [Brevibacillus marinus]